MKQHDYDIVEFIVHNRAEICKDIKKEIGPRPLHLDGGIRMLYYSQLKDRVERELELKLSSHFTELTIEQIKVAICSDLVYNIISDIINDLA